MKGCNLHLIIKWPLVQNTEMVMTDPSDKSLHVSSGSTGQLQISHFNLYKIDSIALSNTIYLFSFIYIFALEYICKIQHHIHCLSLIQQREYNRCLLNCQQKTDLNPQDQILI